MANLENETVTSEANKPSRKKGTQARAKPASTSKTKSSPYLLPDVAPAPDESKFPIYPPTHIYLPEKIIPDKKHILILNQEQEGNSVGCAIAELINYLTSRSGKMYHASPRMIYELAKIYDGIPGIGDTGSYIWAGLYALTIHGVANDTVWPYVPGKSDRELTPERAQAASQFKVKSFERVSKDRDTLRTAIVEHGGVVCSASVHDGWFKFPLSVIPFTGKEQIRGGAAFPILGYTPDGFIIQMPWGTEGISIKLEGEDYPGLMLWTYPDFEKNFIDAWVVQLPGSDQKSAWALRAGYSSDNASAMHVSDDQLNIMPDVRAICALLAARDVQPPLALGLFGNWGTGKSFFMRLMQIEIEHLAENARKNPGKTPFYERIVKIEFNAWHYLDTNLWASLVSEIFGRLHDEISTSKDISVDSRKDLLNRLGSAQGIYRHSRLEYEDAQRAQQAAQVALDEALDQVRRQQKRQLTFQEIEQKSVLVAQAFGIPQLAQSTSALTSSAAQLEAVHTRLGKIWKMVWQSPDRWKLLVWLVVIILGPVLLGLLVTLLTPNLSEALQQFSQRAITVLAWVAGIGGWLAPRLKQLNNGLSNMEDVAKQIQAVPQVNDSTIATLLAEEQMNQQDTLKVEARARTTLEEAQKNVTELQQKLDELSPRWQMQEFILSRSSSEDYSKQLGLISLIRRDFEKLSQLLRENQEYEQRPMDESQPTADEDSMEAKPTPALPFQRIILYIDDLDRCSPDRVVDVLEAVHLLLAFPLFIVVVAVDPRWLRTCLEIRYKDLLIRDKKKAEEDVGLDQAATPQDYLEKIFQIPFYLRPLSSSNFKTLVQGMLGAEVAPEARESAALLTRGQIEGPVDITEKSAEAPLAGANVTSMLTTDRIAPQVKALEEGEINPDRLTLKLKELDDMLHLSALFRTPRAVKRFINTYRLVRVGIQPEAMDAFIGTSEAPGKYRIAMVLLAVVAGYPNLAPTFLHLLLDEMRSPEPAKAWSDFLDACRAGGPEGKTEAQPGEVLASAAEGESSSQFAESRPLQVEWQGLCNALQSISQDGFLPEDLSQYYDLVPPVARFSFSVSDLPGLRKK